MVWIKMNFLSEKPISYIVYSSSANVKAFLCLFRFSETQHKEIEFFRKVPSKGQACLFLTKTEPWVVFEITLSIFQIGFQFAFKTFMEIGYIFQRKGR